MHKWNVYVINLIPKTTNFIGPRFIIAINKNTTEKFGLGELNLLPLK